MTLIVEDFRASKGTINVGPDFKSPTGGLKTYKYKYYKYFVSWNSIRILSSGCGIRAKPRAEAYYFINFGQNESPCSANGTST